MKRPIQIVFIGASAGGVSAIQKILPLLSDRFSAPVVVVQHMPQDFQLEPQQAFGRYSSKSLRTAIDKMPIQNDHVYFAPPGYHLLVESTHEFALSQDEAVHFARPSIDVSFESAALAFGKNVCGILLTGANEDGAAGLKVIQDVGGYTMVQDPEEAEAVMMPLAALKKMKPDYVGTLGSIAGRLVEMAGGNSDE